MGWLDVLIGGVGTGIGGVGQAVAGAREKRMEEERQAKDRALREADLTERRRQFDEGRFTPVETILPFLPEAVRVRMQAAAPGGKVPTAIVPSFLQDLLEQAKQARETEQVRGISEALEGWATTMPSPERAEMGPASVDPRMLSLARMVRNLPLGEASKIVAEQVKPRNPMLVSDTTTGVLEPGTGKVTPVPQAPAQPFTPPTGYQPPSYSVGPRGRVTTTYKPPVTPDPIKQRAEERRERMDKITLGLMERFFGVGGGQPGAAPLLEPSLSFGPGGARVGLTRAQLGEEDKKALRAYDSILAAVNELDTFTDKEITQYAGFLNRGIRDLRQFAGTMPGLEGLSDARYAHFRALTGRLTGTAFAEGGKQLTPFEASVVFTYTPTGKEWGGPTEFRAKKDQLAKYTMLRRQLVARYAERGINPLTIPNEVWDQQIREGMQAAGLPVPESAGAKRQPGAAPLPPQGEKEQVVPGGANDPLEIRR